MKSSGEASGEGTGHVEEQFEIFSEAGDLLGQMARSRVHAQGHWHKSAHIFLFASTGGLYLQLRAADKDLYASLWDYSVGEHLQPGESYLQGALRGLSEELGISGIDLEPLGQVQQSRSVLPEARDFELQQAFRGTWDGPVHADRGEVEDVKIVDLISLSKWIERSPGDFTPWLLRDLKHYGILV